MDRRFLGFVIALATGFGAMGATPGPSAGAEDAGQFIAGLDNSAPKGEVALLSVDPIVNDRLTELRQAKLRFEARQAQLTAAATDADQLTALYDIDQEALGSWPDTKGLNDAQFIEVNRAFNGMNKDLTRKNVALVEGMIPAAGWFSNKVYGQKAATGAYLVIQHSNDPVLQKRYLPAIERMVRTGEALASEYAMIYDRAAVGEGRLQRYGTQMHCVDGRMVPQPMEDPARIDERRAPMKFRWAAYKDYTAMFNACPRSLQLPG